MGRGAKIYSDQNLKNLWIFSKNQRDEIFSYNYKPQKKSLAFLGKVI